MNLDQITFSLDGNREKHDLIRGKGNFDNTVMSMHELHSLGTKHLRINTVLTRYALSGINDLLELAGKYCDEINFFYMRISGRANDLISSALTMPELIKLDAELENVKAQYPHVNILHGSQVLHSNSIKTKDDFTSLMNGLPDGLTRFNIFSNGAIHPGGYTPRLTNNYYLGNIVEENYTLMNIWHNSKTLDEFRKKGLKVLEKCSSCKHIIDKSCQGASMEMDIFGKNNGKNIYCLLD